MPSDLFDRVEHTDLSARAPRKFPRPANHWKLARDDDLSGFGPRESKNSGIFLPRWNRRCWKKVLEKALDYVRFIIQFWWNLRIIGVAPQCPRASQMEHAVLGSLATSMRGVLVRSVTFGAAAGADSAATFDQSPNLAVTQASWRTKIWAMVNTHYMFDGHPIHTKDPYNGYYKSLWTIGWLAPFLSVFNGY